MKKKLKESEKNKTNMHNIKFLTRNQQFILASSSKTRIERSKEIFGDLKIVEHRLDEKKEKIKNKQKTAEDQAKLLSRKKAESIQKEFPKQIIIASDQILECKGKILSKPMNLKEAEENINYLTGKTHTLFSSIYVIKESKLYFEELKKAEIQFKKISHNQISKYLNENKETALSSVGSYKIEENKKYGFVDVISGDWETIIGFPLKNFLIKLKGEFL